MAEKRRQKRQVSISGAELAIANPKAQKLKEIQSNKNKRFKADLGFMLIICIPKNK